MKSGSGQHALTSAEKIKIIIIGASASGAGVAAKLRRLNEDAHIVLIERASSPSYANCGIPYYLGDVIRNPEAMQVVNEDDFTDLLNVDLRLRHDRVQKQIKIKNLQSGAINIESYDKLVLATGTKPRDLGIRFSDNAPVFHLSGKNESENAKKHLNLYPCAHGVVIGAGFIGLETAENLHRLGLNVSVVEAGDRVLAQWDGEMSAAIKSHLRDKGVRLYFNESVAQVNGNKVILASGKILRGDIVIVAGGVEPNSTLAKMAGLQLGECGGILVNQFLETEDNAIYAVGDAIEVPDHLLGNFRWLPFAGPAHKQARVAAANILGRRQEYQAPHPSAIVKVFSLAAAITGYSESQLRQQRIAYEKVYTESASHAHFYPGSHSMVVKLLFTPDQGRVLGAQIIGSNGVDKRIDVISTAMQAQMRVTQLSALDLSYAPPYSSAKDPVNVAGMVASNVINHKVQYIHWNELDMSLLSGSIMLDVRSEAEHDIRALPGAINIPLEQLRRRMRELPKHEDIVIYCSYGKKSYFAYQMLIQHGYKRVKCLSGGITVYGMAKMHRQLEMAPVAEVHAAQARVDKVAPTETSDAKLESKINSVLEIDASGLTCPGPIMTLAKAMATVAIGDVVKVVATDFGFAADVKTWCRRKGHQLLSIDSEQTQISVLLQKVAVK